MGTIALQMGTIQMGWSNLKCSAKVLHPSVLLVLYQVHREKRERKNFEQVSCCPDQVVPTEDRNHEADKVLRFDRLNSQNMLNDRVEPKGMTTEHKHLVGLTVQRRVLNKIIDGH